MKELTETILRAIVDDVDAIDVMVTDSRTTFIIEVKVAREDIGKVIGKRGSMANAIRTILTNAATKRGKKTVLQIIE